VRRGPCSPTLLGTRVRALSKLLAFRSLQRCHFQRAGGDTDLSVRGFDGFEYAGEDIVFSRAAFLEVDDKAEGEGDPVFVKDH